MKVALLILLGLVLGLLSGAALGVGAGVAWSECVGTGNVDNLSTMLVFFTFMPVGALLGGTAGAILSGMVATSATHLVMEPVRARDPRRC